MVSGRRLGQAMRRYARTISFRPWVAVAVAGGAMAMAGCGSATSSSAGAGASTSAGKTGATTSSGSTGGVSALTVAPKQGGPTTRFALRFLPPVTSGPRGSTRLGFSLSVTGGTGGGGCIGARTVPVPAATKGVAVTIPLSPAALGGSWCRGVHTARVIEVQGPVCNPGTMCPQYLRVVGTVGETTFTVSSSP